MLVRRAWQAACKAVREQETVQAWPQIQLDFLNLYFKKISILLINPKKRNKKPEKRIKENTTPAVSENVDCGLFWSSFSGFQSLRAAIRPPAAITTRITPQIIPDNIKLFMNEIFRFFQIDYKFKACFRIVQAKKRKSIIFDAE